MEPNQVPNQAPVPVAPKKSSSVWKIVIIVILVLLALSAVAMVAVGYFVRSLFTSGGVENFIEGQIEKETGKDVDFDMGGNGTMNIESADGSVQINTGASGSVAVPKVILGVTSIMPGAVAKSAVSVNEAPNQKAASWAFFASTASAEDIKAYYVKEMTGRGWVKAGEASQSGMTMMAFTKGDEQFVVNIGVVPGTNSIDSGFQLILTGK